MFSQVFVCICFCQVYCFFHSGTELNFFQNGFF
jgi:hypothetical protein